MDKLVIGTRGSELALKQAKEVVSAIAAARPELQMETRVIKTTGDENQSTPLSHMGDRGLFVKQIEEALLRGDIDVAVHSLKDLPSQIPSGLTLAAVLKREDPRDAWVSPRGYTLEDIPKGGRVGTSSLRRAAQLSYHRPDLKIVPLRGNLNTRLKKAQELEAIILAVAGLKRLNMEEHITQIIPEDICLPAVGQGALGIEIRENEPEIAQLLASVNHRDTFDAVQAERAFLRQIEGGCQVPVGALAQLNQSDKLTLAGMAAATCGRPFYRDQIEGFRKNSEVLGADLAERLLQLGAGETLAEERRKGEEENE